MKAKSIKGRSPQEIEQALEESMSDGFTPALAIVFLSISCDRIGIIKILDKKNITIYGATTNGEFIDEQIEKESIAIMLLDMNRKYFFVMAEEFPEKNYREITRSFAKK